MATIETAKTIIAVHLARAKKAAVSGQEKLGKILEQMAEIEGSLQRAREIQQRRAAAGAATFVQSLNKGRDHEARGESGPSLAWYLDAHRQYPPSKFAQEKIGTFATRILPGSSPANP